MVMGEKLFVVRNRVFLQAKGLSDRIPMAAEMAELFSVVPDGKAVGIRLFAANAHVEPAAHIMGDR